MIEVHIIGGPFDGLERRFGGDISTLQQDLIWLVCEDAFLQSGHRLATRHDRVTSVAIYTLISQSLTANYHYVGSVSPQTLSSALHTFHPVPSPQ